MYLTCSCSCCDIVNCNKTLKVTLVAWNLREVLSLLLLYSFLEGILPNVGTAQPGAVLPVSSMMPHLPMGAGLQAVSPCHSARIWFWSCFQFMWSLSPLFADEQGDSIPHFPGCSSTPSTFMISEGITHPLVFSHVGANKLGYQQLFSRSTLDKHLPAIDNVLL